MCKRFPETAMIVTDLYNRWQVRMYTSRMLSPKATLNVRHRQSDLRNSFSIESRSKPRSNTDTELTHDIPRAESSLELFYDGMWPYGANAPQYRLYA